MGVEGSWFKAIDAFGNASLDGNWLNALAILAEATGSWSGELIGLGAEQAVPFNLMSDMDENYSREFIAMGGPDPRLNPIVREGTKIAENTVITTADFITAHDRRHNPIIVEHMNRYDIHHVCLTPLIKDSHLLIGLAVVRSESQGEFSHTEREIFANLAPHMRAAIKMQMALEHKSSLLVSDTLETLSLPVFVCDRRGLVKHMTPEAEALVSKGNSLTMRQGILNCLQDKTSRKLRDAIASAATNISYTARPAATSLVIEGADSPLVLEIFSLSQRDFKFTFEPKVLVVVKQKHPDLEQTKKHLMNVYRLTTAEADVVTRLVAGESPEQISCIRNSSIGTVRAQIRTIYSKCAVNRCSELITKVNQLRFLT